MDKYLYSVTPTGLQAFKQFARLAAIYWTWITSNVADYEEMV